MAAETSLFIGLFRGQPPNAQARAELKNLGVDPDRLESKYRVDIWARTIDIMRRSVYPELAIDEGCRRLGYDFAHGFEETIGGRMVLSLLPLLTPGKLLARMPRIFKLGRPDLEASWVSTSPTSGELKIGDRAQVSPYFDIGLIDFIVFRMRAKVESRVEWHGLDRFTIHYSWV